MLQVPAKAWTPAYDAGGTERPGAWVAELTGLLDLAGWPKGMIRSANFDSNYVGKINELYDAMWGEIEMTTAFAMCR